MIEYETVRYKRNSFQKRVKRALETEKRIVACFAAWRTGKTDYVSIEHIIRRQLFDNPDVLHLIAANTYSQLIDSTLRSLFAKLDWLGIPHVPETLPRQGNPTTLRLFNGDKWVEFLCRSMDSFDTVAGVTLGSVWLDEVWATEKWTFDLALSRLSDKRSKHLQMVLTTTKDEPTHWMYTDIVETLAKNEQRDDGLRASDYIEVVEGKTSENTVNLIDGYISQQLTTLEPRLAKRFIENEWVSTLDGLCYPYYDSAIHQVERGVDLNRPIILCLDFNTNPCIWELGQDSKAYSYFFDEIVLKNTDIFKVCGEAKRRLIALWGDERKAKSGKLIFYGDHQHGTARGLSAVTSSWELVRTEFNGWNCEFRHKSNPRIADRLNATNSRHRNATGRVSFGHSANCMELKKDYEGVNLEMMMNVSKQGDRTHASSAVDYFMNYEYPVMGQLSRFQ
jgi:hypothetical protein